jgi:heat shock protein HslJ
MAEVEQTPWTLVRVPGVDLPPAVSPSLTLEEGRASGHAGCNRFTGAYELAGERLTFGPLAGTLMACPPPLEAVERAYLAALARVASWRVEEDALVLLDADGQELLRYEPASLTGAWEVTGLLQGSALSSPLPGTTLGLELGDDGACGGSAGCNRFRGSYRISGQGIELSALAATRRACAEPDGVMEQEHAFLALLGDAARYRLDGRSLDLLDAGGGRLVALTRAAE